jgi:hypothetical protein
LPNGEPSGAEHLSGLLILRSEQLLSAGKVGLSDKNLAPPTKGLPCLVVCQVRYAMGAANPSHAKHAAKNLGFTFVGDRC